MIRLEGITKFYMDKGGIGKGNRVYALKDLNQEFSDGKIYAVFGNSGCGKTTLANVISGYSTPDSGHVYYDGSLVKRENSVRIVFQDPYTSLNGSKDVAWHMETTARINGMNPEKIWNIYENLGFFRSNYENRMVWTLSGGELQILSFTIAFAQKPRCIVLDEPFSYLDTMTINRVMNLMRNTKDKILYIYMDNDMNRCGYISDDILIMDGGSIIEQGQTDTVIMHPEKEFTKGIIRNIPDIRKRIE